MCDHRDVSNRGQHAFKSDCATVTVWCGFQCPGRCAQIAQRCTSFVNRKQKMYGAWALLQRQYGRLQCPSSVGLLFRVYMVCVPPTASYGCEVWGHYKLTAATAASRGALAKSHLHILRQISGVRSKTAVSILLAEFGLMCLPDQWLLRAATFWNALAALPPTSIYKNMALDTSTWAKGVSNENYTYRVSPSYQPGRHGSH